MHRSIITLLTAVALVAVSTACSEDDELPALGSFRVTNLGGRPSSVPLVESFPAPLVLFRVDTRGPKEYAEIYVEHWNGTTLVSTEILFHKKFGSDVIEHLDGGTNHVIGPAFSHERAVFAVRFIDLPEPLPDGRRTLAIVNTGNPDEPKVTWPTSTLVRLAVDRSGGPRWWPSLAADDGSDVHSDTQALLLWQGQESPDAKESFKPPYPVGSRTSRLLFRFVDS